MVYWDMIDILYGQCGKKELGTEFPNHVMGKVEE